MSRATKPIMQLDAQGQILHDSQLDVTIRCEWSGTNLIYKAQARIGSSESDAVWQIMKLTYSGSNITSKIYPKDSAGEVSSDYIFKWSDRASYTYA